MIGGRQDADVAGPRLRFPDPFVAPLLEQPQQLRLQAAAAGRRFRPSSSVPPSAAATLPIVSRTAPVNAPWTWPNSSLSNNSAERLGQGTVMKGPAARGLRAWMARARTPLPVPLSPRNRIVASLAAVLKATSRASRIWRLVGLQIGLGHDRADLLLEFFDLRLQPPQLRDPLQDQREAARA